MAPVYPEKAENRREREVRRESERWGVEGEEGGVKRMTVTQREPPERP
jgi:hypothetical protein